MTQTLKKSSRLALRVMIVEDESLISMLLQQQLENLGHSVLGRVSDTAAATAMFREQTPDLVLLDIRLADTDGLELAAALQKERPCPMIVVSAYSDQELLERAADVGIFGYLIKPVEERLLEAQIGVAIARFREREALAAEAARLQKDLETRKLLDRAKGILMKRANLTEDDAHRRLLQESQKRRLPLAQLCKMIIESETVMRG